MKVLLVLKNFDFGGAENHVCDLANSLVDLGNEVILVSGKGRQESRLNKKVVFIPYRLRDHGFLYNIYLLRRVIKKNNIDIIHAHQRISIFYSCIISKLLKVPLVVTIHGRTRLDLKSKLTRNTPDRLIFVSEQVLKVSACYNQIKEKSVVIPNGVEIIENDYPRKPFSICYVSRLDHKHAEVVLVMIRDVLPLLLSKYPEITFYIIGEGKGSKYIQAEADSLNMKSNKQVCFILGFQQDVKEIFLESSLVMGVGRVAIEALACGVPVFSINQKRLGSIVTVENIDFYQINNFVAVGNQPPTPDAVYRTLDEFYKNIERHYSEIKLLQEKIRQNFDRTKVTQKIVRIYDEALLTNR